MYYMRGNPPNLIVCTGRYVDWRIVRILRLQVDFPLVEQEPLDRELFAHSYHDNSIVCGGDRPVHHDDIAISDAGAVHGVAGYLHEESADWMRYTEIIQAQALLF